MSTCGNALLFLAVKEGKFNPAALLRLDALPGRISFVVTGRNQERVLPPRARRTENFAAKPRTGPQDRSMRQNFGAEPVFWDPGSRGRMGFNLPGRISRTKGAGKEGSRRLFIRSSRRLRANHKRRTKTPSRGYRLQSLRH